MSDFLKIGISGQQTNQNQEKKVSSSFHSRMGRSNGRRRGNRQNLGANREEDDHLPEEIHLNYGAEERGEEEGVPRRGGLCCGCGREAVRGLEDPELVTDHLCCMDVWRNMVAYPVAGPPRTCTPEETYTISMAKVAVKQFVSGGLFALVVWFFYLETLKEDTPGEMFNCDPDNNKSIIAAENLFNQFDDEGVSFCYFKSTMIIVSFIFLLPFLLETFSIVTIIWVSSINNDVLIPIADTGHYAGYDEIFNEVHSFNPLSRTIASLQVVFTVPKLILKISAESDANIPTWMLLFEIAWKFMFFMVPDLVLTVALLPVSYFVMQSSATPEDIFINLVAVQVFAQLDDIFVKMMLRPRASVGEAIQNYVSENPNASVPKYSPLEAYTLNERRHEMGIKVKNMGHMKRFHEYEGMHLVT